MCMDCYLFNGSVFYSDFVEESDFDFLRSTLVVLFRVEFIVNVFHDYIIRLNYYVFTKFNS